eukprot:745062-Amorphochlora_amoeboformis.AAC.1
MSICIHELKTCTPKTGQKDYDKTLAPALLFALNLATRVVGFVSALLDKIPDKSKKMPEYFGDPNDLMAVSQSSVEVLQQFRKAFYKTLRRRVSPVLEHWIKVGLANNVRNMGSLLRWGVPQPQKARVRG